jgi:signal transduction histidine kinase
LGRAVSNLIENALKYTPAGGTIVVEARARADGAMELLVEDDGPGIPPSERARVVDRFARLDDHRDAPGAGLGLSLVAAIAKAHDGKLELRDGRRAGTQPGGGVGLGAALVLPSWGVVR